MIKKGKLIEPDILRAMRAIRPGADFTLYGDDIAGIVWRDKKQRLPTEGELREAIAALPPPPEFVPTAVLLARLSPAQYGAIRRAAMSALATGDAQLELWLEEARVAAGGVDLNSPRTIAARAALVGAGLLTEQEASDLFKPE